MRAGHALYRGCHTKSHANYEFLCKAGGSTLLPDRANSLACAAGQRDFSLQSRRLKFWHAVCVFTARYFCAVQRALGFLQFLAGFDSFHSSVRSGLLQVSAAFCRKFFFLRGETA